MAAPSPAEIHYQMEHIHESKVADIIASHVICFVLACIAVVLRFTSRRIGKNAIKADDWFIVAALVFTAAVMADNLISVHFGLGKHSILIKNPAGIAQTIIAGEAVYNPAMACIKFSILLFYRRIFSVSRPFVITLWFVAIFIFGYSTAQTFGAIFQCVPIRSNWDPTIHRKCINTDLGATIIAALNVVTDFVILVLPMPLLWRLHTSRKNRYQIMGIFLLGGFVCFASIYRCVVIHSLSLEDMSWSDSSTIVWTMVELGIAIVSACLPTLRPIFSRSIDGLQKLRSNSLGASGNRKPSDPSWPGNLPLPESASKEGWTPSSPDTITLDAESERKLREPSEQV